jgi:hypothetical protein
MDKLKEDVILLLIDYGILYDNSECAKLDLKIIPRRKPNHGRCCTCGDCGHHHDDCVCVHNAVVKRLEKIFSGVGG